VRTALVLGGNSEIARAVLERFADELQHVVLAVRDPSASGSGPFPLGAAKVDVVRWDANDVARHTSFVDEVAGRLGSVDLVLCAVGMLGHHAGESMAPDQVADMAANNFAGPAAALAAAAPVLRQQGAGVIVVLSSVAGVRPRRSNYVYGASKSGLDAFARGLGDSLAGSGVRVVTVRPGFVRSRMTEGLEPAPFASDPSDVASAVHRTVISGRGGVVWVPPLLGPLFAVLVNVPVGVWRRISGDR
jgi:decaprenylphospho-beta-D-erythro-pentofuranosid-2-ulose 2-reductase